MSSELVCCTPENLAESLIVSISIIGLCKDRLGKRLSEGYRTGLTGHKHRFCKGFHGIQKVQLVLVHTDNTLLKKTSDPGFCQHERAYFVDKLLEAVTGGKR